MAYLQRLLCCGALLLQSCLHLAELLLQLVHLGLRRSQCISRCQCLRRRAGAKQDCHSTGMLYKQMSVLEPY